MTITLDPHINKTHDQTLFVHFGLDFVSLFKITLLFLRIR